MSIFMTPLISRDVLRCSSLEAAPKLLGTLIAKGSTAVIITEVEAYGGSDDEASHAFRGVSSRNMSMFGDAATLYVYISYGIHKCMNVVTGDVGNAQALLIRSGIVLKEAELNGRSKGIDSVEMIRGPGRLGQALGVNLADDGTDLLCSDIWRLCETRMLLDLDDLEILQSPRVGISKAKEFDWRFQVSHEDAYKKCLTHLNHYGRFG